MTTEIHPKNNLTSNMFSTVVSPLASNANISKLQELSTTNNSNQSIEDTEARDVANKFESLLIHNMLKSMRKTTMSEDKSNARGIYDDMLDEKYAEVMIESGGIGIADQIVSQIKEQQSRQIETDDPNDDIEHLRSLSSNIDRELPLKTTSNQSNDQLATIGLQTKDKQLQLVNSLWGYQEDNNLTNEQQNFIQSLMPHAIRNAQKLGTSPYAIVAIASLETGWGQSTIKDVNGKESYNYFGIKASDSDEQHATTLTTEYLQGIPQKLHAQFKTFNSPADAVDGFAKFILSNPRYSEALNQAGNPEQFLEELQSAGYATDPRYASKAISIMRKISGASLPL